MDVICLEGTPPGGDAAGGGVIPGAGALGGAYTGWAADGGA